MVVSILGSKTPNIQNLAVGGVANAINPDNQSALNMERLYYIKTLIDEVQGFVRNAMLVDVAAVAALYADWTGYGKGVTNYLSAPDMPMDTKGTIFALPGGYIENADFATYKPIKSFNDDFFKNGVKESIKHSWYKGDWNRAPGTRPPTRTTRACSMTANTPGSRPRPSTASRRRSVRWPTCCACMLQVMQERRRSTSRTC